MSANFDLGSGIPLDSRLVKADITARNALNTVTQRYEGMPVYVVATGKNYQLRGGVADANWVELVDVGEPPLGNPGTNGFVLASTTAGVRSWIAKNSDLSFRATNGTYYSEINYNRIHINTGSFDVLYMNPFEASGTGASPYIFDTAVDHNTAGDNIILVRNNGVVKVTFDKDGNINIPTGSSYKVNGVAIGTGGEPALGNPAADGYVLTSTMAGVRSWSAFPSVTYTNAATTPSQLGGIAPGTAFAAQTIKQMFDALLYPYQSPVFSSLAITGQATTLESGVFITSGVKTFTWASTNDANINAGTVVIRDQTADIGISAGLNATPKTADLDIGVAKTVTAVSGNYQWCITGTNSQSAAIAKAYFTVYFYSPFYYGVGAAALSVASLQGLTKQIVARGNKTYSFSPIGQKFYFAYPAAHGYLTSIKDPNGFDITSSFAVTTQSFTNNSPNYQGVTMNYYVYESTTLQTQTGFTITFNF